MNREEKIKAVLSYKTKEEYLFTSDPKKWKIIALKNFNRVYNQELGVMDLLKMMEREGVTFLYSETLNVYPLTEILEYIAELAEITDFKAKRWC